MRSKVWITHITWTASFLILAACNEGSSNIGSVDPTDGLAENDSMVHIEPIPIETNEEHFHLALTITAQSSEICKGVYEIPNTFETVLLESYLEDDCENIALEPLVGHWCLKSWSGGIAGHVWYPDSAADMERIFITDDFYAYAVSSDGRILGKGAIKVEALEYAEGLCVFNVPGHVQSRYHGIYTGAGTFRVTANFFSFDSGPSCSDCLSFNYVRANSDIE